MNAESSIHDGGIPASGRDGADAMAVRQIGSDLVMQVDLDAIGACMAALPTAALLAELEGIVEALDNLDPARRRRRAGFVGRLLGRDLVAQAQPDPVEQRVRLHLSNAHALAAELAKRAAELKGTADQLQQRIGRLDELLAHEHAATPAAGVPAETDVTAQAARVRRLADLVAIAATWRATQAQIAMLSGHADMLLDRHVQVRDLLVPLWRQRTAIETGAVGEADATRLSDAVRAQLTALRETIRLSDAPERADADRPPKEPSP